MFEFREFRSDIHFIRIVWKKVSDNDLDYLINIKTFSLGIQNGKELKEVYRIKRESSVHKKWL